MAAVDIVHNDNAPVRFNPTTAGACDFDKRNYCQLAIPSDYLSFSWKGSQCTGADDVVCGSMAESCVSANYNSVGWRYYNNVSGQYYYHSSTQSKYVLINKTALTGYYKIVFTVGVGVDNATTGFSSGTTLIGTVDVNAYTTAGALDTSIYNFSTPGIKTVYAVMTGTNIGFAPSADFNGTISNIQAYKINTDYSVAIFDSTNTLAWLGIGSDISNNSDDYFYFSKTWASMGLSSGCYYAYLYNGCDYPELVVNGTFTTDLSSWTAPATWTWNSGKACHSGVTNLLRQAISTTISIPYFVSLDVTGMTGGTLLVKYNGVTYLTITANGHYSVTITGTGGSDSLGFDADGTFDGCVDNISMRIYPTEILTDDSNFSNCFSLKATQPCTKLLKWYNDDYAFNMPYNLAGLGTIFHNIRVECLLRNPRYPESQDRFKNSAGEGEITYFSSEKIWELLIGEQPEYVHDALRLAKGHDHFFIDGVEYLCTDDEYEPEWSSTPTLLMAKSRLSVQKKTDNNINKKC